MVDLCSWILPPVRHFLHTDHYAACDDLNIVTDVCIVSQSRHQKWVKKITHQMVQPLQEASTAQICMTFGPRTEKNSDSVQKSEFVSEVWKYGNISADAGALLRLCMWCHGFNPIKGILRKFRAIFNKMKWMGFFFNVDILKKTDYKVSSHLQINLIWACSLEIKTNLAAIDNDLIFNSCLNSLHILVKLESLFNCTELLLPFVCSNRSCCVSSTLVRVLNLQPLL